MDTDHAAEEFTSQDLRFAGWERDQAYLRGMGDDATRSEVAVKEICGT